MADFPLHPYDVAMLVILAVCTFFGLWKGLAWQVASVASFVVSYFVAMQGSGYMAPWVSLREPWNHLIAMLILFVATSAAIWLVFRLVAGVIDRIQLKAFDRQLGALLGLGKGVLICLVVTFFAVTLSEALRQEVLRARSGYYIALLIDRLNPVLPPELRGLIGEYLEELDRKLQPDPAREGNQKTEPSTSEGGFPQTISTGIQSTLGRVQEAIDGGFPGGPSGAEAARSSLELFSRQALSGNASAQPAETKPFAPNAPPSQGAELRGRLVPLP